ncbi:FLU1-II [Laetiporus sulphureus 93-53]|uniref:Glutamine synthetase n=1 Tax=Laetiporus sulphureus 93-53 TaxID=1314785 RepID=A0A165F1S6_9APHY|nr:FLU1-II [Laetiporus sulphureus 93-53]KZT08191.1 FLU1-II [Laetiporus sulphureus 93-53]
MSATTEDYGVVYKPTPTGSSSYASVDDLPLQRLGIKFVRIQWVDLTNTVRFRVLPVSYFKKLYTTPRPAVGLAHVTLGLVGTAAARGFSGSGEHLYVPDLSSFRVCPYAPGHAVVMGWFQEKMPSPTGSFASELCPRALLKRIVDDAQEKAGLSFLAGFESEFILLSATSPEPVAVNNAGWSCSAKSPSGSVENAVLEEIAEDLLEAGIELQMYHAESAPGQYEVVTGPLPPLEAADAIVHTRETIRNVASKHGLRATFAPRLHSDDCGSGTHLHLSLHGGSADKAGSKRSDASLAPTLTPTERSFVQSLLTHLPALCALTLPTSASYARVLDGIWSGGTYACWGTDNKEVPVRLCGPRGAHHFELKTVDGTASPYLVLAGVLAAGVRGVLEGHALTIGDCQVPAAEMNREQRAAVGLVNPGRLPRTIGDARKLLAGDSYLGEALGAVFVERYIAVNELLEEFMQADTEAATVTRLVEFY